MSNSNNPLSSFETNNWFSQKNTPTILLASLVFFASFASDRYLPNSSLSTPLIASTLISALLTNWGIPKLKTLRFNQIIRDEGPNNHQAKAGTPSMGGLLIVPIGLIIGTLVSLESKSSSQVLAISCITLAFMGIGTIDDWFSCTRKTNTGLSPKGKFLLQLGIGILFLLFAGINGWISSEVFLFNEHSIELGLLIWPVALFVLLAEANATNLTDGLDGLASGCGVLIFTGLALQLILRDSNSDPGISSFCMAMAGTWLGFLFHNRNPARIFMGDTGSLAMGAALTGVGIFSNSLWALLIMGGVFLAESLSVIVQVLVFKITKRVNKKGLRVFLMAPLHHHYELAGHRESSIVQTFWLITLALIILSLMLYTKL